MSESSQKVHEEQDKFISFKLGDQEFCVDIMAVREIRGWTKPTALPHAPEYVCGVINLRGTVLPIIDFAARMGMGKSTPDASRVIIVMQIEERIIGIMVDAVSDILSIEGSTIQPTPDVGSSKAKSFFKGVASIEERMIRVVDASMFTNFDEIDIAA